jgi:hypothetical protein
LSEQLPVALDVGAIAHDFHLGVGKKIFKTFNQVLFVYHFILQNVLSQYTCVNAEVW